MSLPQSPHPLHRERIVDLRTREIVYTGSPSEHSPPTPDDTGDGFTPGAESLLAGVRAALQKRGYYVLGAHELNLICDGANSTVSKDQLLRAFALRAGGELQPGSTRSTALLRRGPHAHLEH